MNLKLSFHFPRLAVAAALGLLATLSDAAGQLVGQRRPAPPVTLIQGATIHPGNGEALEGDILIQAGKIAALGADVAAPERASVTTVDGSGKHVYPGLIDADSSLLLTPFATAHGNAQVNHNVLDAIDLYQPLVIEKAISRGVTCVGLGPRNRGLSDGTAAVLKLLPDAELEDMVIAEDLALCLEVGASSTTPIARLREIKSLRDQLRATEDYIEAWEDYAEKLEEYEKELEELRKKEEPEKPDDAKPEPDGDGEEDGDDDQDEEDTEEPEPEDDEKQETAGSSEWFHAIFDRARQDDKTPPSENGEQENGDKKKKDEEDEGPKKPKKPAYDETKEIWRKVLEGDLGVRGRAHRAADILNLLELKERFHFKLTLCGGTDAHEVAGAVKDGGVGLIVSQHLDLSDEDLDGARLLNNAGVRFAISSPGDGRQSAALALAGAAAVAGGLNPESALRAMTLEAARVLGVDQNIGSLEVGKDADLVLADGLPTDTTSRVEQVYINGKVVFQR